MNDLFLKLDNLFNEYDTFIIMGHSNPDLDSFGSSLALYTRITSLGKMCYIFLENEYNDYNTLMQKALNKVSGVNYTNSKNNDYFGKTLLIIIDVHQKNRLEYPNILDICQDYVILDHHIKDSKCLKSSKLMYINSNLSSMIELMTYYLDYSNINVNSEIATIMLAGLEIDTNAYNLKTTSRTYHAASMLVEMGADITAKQEMLKESKEDFVKRADYIKNSYTIDNIAMCVLPEVSKPETLAEIADVLLTFDNITASFALAKLNEKEFGVSARSLNNIDVLKAIKKLGGGGSRTNAATKTNKNLSEIKNIIIKSMR